MTNQNSKQLNVNVGDLVKSIYNKTLNAIPTKRQYDTVGSAMMEEVCMIIGFNNKSKNRVFILTESGNCGWCLSRGWKKIT